jgi:hypothetical protein
LVTVTFEFPVTGEVDEMAKVAVIWVLLDDWMVAEIPCTVSTIGLEPKPVPEMVTFTEVPIAPCAGLMLVMTGLTLSPPLGRWTPMGQLKLWGSHC